MSLILCIETATPVCSVALGEGGKLLEVKEDSEGNTHASRITLLIEELMMLSGKNLEDLDAIAVSKGPGSYTGLRVGVSVAKGLCCALDKPLIGISTLKAMAWGIISSMKERISPGVKINYFIPMLDARRMEVYYAAFNEQMEETEQAQARIVDSGSFSKILQDGTVCFFGSGASKLRQVISSENALFIENYHCSATHLPALSEACYSANQFEDTAYFEPFYLKNFIGTTPRKLI